MNAVQAAAERDVLHALAAHYVGRGYRFLVNPPPDFVPSFLEGFRPDAIALKDDGGVVFEIKAGRGAGLGRAEELARRTKEHPGWTFEIVFADNFARERGWIFAPEQIEPPSMDDVAQLRSEIQTLIDNGQTRPALLMSWAVLEALTRSLMPSGRGRRSRPLTGWQVIEQLATLGRVDEAEVGELKRLLTVRNALAHGDLTANLPLEDVVALLSLIDRLRVEKVEVAVAG